MTGSTRRRRRTTRSRPRPTTASWPPPATTAHCARCRPRPRSSARPTTPATSPPSRTASGRPSTSTTSPPADASRSDCATVYALAIEFDLLDDADRQGAGDRLAELARENGYRVSTGFAGTPFVTGALSSTGHLDDAYRLLLERECPSWLYPVTMGATTVWERWDSMLPDGTINPGEMTSFNHYALGAVADWMHRTIGGIAPASPGYAKVVIAPRPGGGLTWAKASLDTLTARSRRPGRSTKPGWSTCSVEVPSEVTATVRLGGMPDQEIGAGLHRFQAHV